MGCRRAFDVDLVACLLDRDRPEWETFRDHYPTCAECAAEVRTWTELQAELAPEHPEPARLVRYQDEPASLRADERRTIRDHAAQCPGCRDELHMLRTTDLPALVRAGSAASRVASTATRRAQRRRLPGRGLGARLRGFVWHPGVAYAVAIALLVPALAPYREVFAPPPSSRDDARRENARVLGRPRAALHDAAAPEDAYAPGQAGARAKVAATESAPTEAFRSGPGQAGEVATAERRAQNERPAAAAPPVWPRLDLTPGSNHLVIAASPGLIVTLPVPGGAATAGPAELRIRDAAGRRELREEYFGPPTSRVLMRIPGEWLEPGRYVVTLRLGEEKPVASATLDIAARAPR